MSKLVSKWMSRLGMVESIVDLGVWITELPY